MKPPLYHLHLETESKRAALFHLPESEWLAAAPRHKALARRLRVTVGWNGDIRDEALKTADFLITNGVPPRDNLRERAPNLKWIQSLATGVDYMLNLTSLRKEVLLTSTRGIHGPQMSEIAFLHMLSLNRNYPQVVRNQEKEDERLDQMKLGL